jgi:hypothetical protein
VEARYVILERVFGLWAGVQDRDRATIAAGAIDLPPNRPVRCRDLDHASRVHADKFSVQGFLRVGVGDHGPTEGGEILGEDRVASCERGVS